MFKMKFSLFLKTENFNLPENVCTVCVLGEGGVNFSIARDFLELDFVQVKKYFLTLILAPFHLCVGILHIVCEVIFMLFLKTFIVNISYFLLGHF